MTVSVLRSGRAIAAWALLGFAAYAVLPWYFLQQHSLLAALAGVWGDDTTASGLVQAARHGRPWLWVGLAGLLLASSGLLLPAGRGQGRLLVGGASLGLIGLLASGFAIGAPGWSFESLEALFGPLDRGQFGMGWGGFIVLASLVALLGSGIARLGYFRSDVFVASSVVGCVALLALFVVYPVLRSLVTGVYDDMGEFSPAALWQRLGTERIWGLGCVGGGTRCGVAWNTLYLALLTAAGTTFMGTLMALWAERGGTRLARPLNALAMLPIITPPFVVGLGLILLFGRAGLCNQFMEWAFGIPPSPWFYGVFGVWLAQMFAFTPIAFMIMRGVVQGVSPSLEEAAQTLRANRIRTFLTVTLPLLKPGLAHAFLVGFIESMADFGNPIILGGQYAVLSTEIFFAIVGASLDPGMAAALALILTVFALAVFFLQRALLGKTSFTTVTGKGDAGMAMPLPRGGRWMCLGGMDVAVHHRLAGGDGRARVCLPRPADRLVAGAHRVPWQVGLRVRRAADLRYSRHGAGRELHHVLQRATGGAHGHRADHRAVLRVSQPAGGRARRHGGLQAARPLARRGLAHAAGQHAHHAAPGGAAPAQAGAHGRADLQLRAVDDHRLRGDLRPHE